MTSKTAPNFNVDSNAMQDDLKCALSTNQPNHDSKRGISKMVIKCPHAGCPHECPLADLEGHLRVCPKKSVDCPFREFGCRQAKLAAEDMMVHMQQESRSHCEALIGLFGDVKRDMEVLKREQLVQHEQMKQLENENKFLIMEINSMKIENESMKNETASMKIENESIKVENRSIKNEYKLLKDENESIREYIKSVKDENKPIREINKSMKDQVNVIKIENESIKREKEALSKQVLRLEEKLARESDERLQSAKRASADMSAFKVAVVSNRDALDTQLKPIKSEIQSIRAHLNNMKSEVQLLKVPAKAGQIDASYDEWLIAYIVVEKSWDFEGSEYFSGAVHPYMYQLASWNNSATGVLTLQLLIVPSKFDFRLSWPFRGAVTISVSNWDSQKKCDMDIPQCQIERPPLDGFSCSTPFVFSHNQLRAAGLNLHRGVRVSCQISIDTSR